MTGERLCDGVTLYEGDAAAAAGLDRYAAARRLPELERDGLVRRGPARRSRVGGRPGVVWVRVRQTNQPKE